jgi:uncharacterized repeat protein (TIGR03803 family)
MEAMSMRHKDGVRALVSTVTVLVMFGALAASASAGTRVIYSFGGDADGEYIDSDLVMDSAGNIYGTSVLGGDFGGGTVFELSPSGGRWVHTVLYSFTGAADGGEPYKGVTLDAQGNLYGTAVTGGTGQGCEGGCGVLYKLTKSGSSWVQSVLHNFTGGDDGSGPGSGVTFDKQGTLFGMTPTGGAYGLGVIYQMKSDLNGNWKFRVLHAFTGGWDGSNGSAGRLILDKVGNLYGVATTGGANGKGVAFRLLRSASGQSLLQTLYAFKGQPDAGFPYGGLAWDSLGNLYGTTYYDGQNNLGAVYELTFKNGAWSESVLYSFEGGSDGSSSIGNLVFDGAGNLYGTTSEGGAGCSCGVIFKLARDSNGMWTESVVHRFQSSPDGAFVYNGMVGDKAGNFYGATVHGGVSGEGSIYRFKPANPLRPVAR